MKFGMFFEHQVPRPWADGDEARVFAEALEQIELADRIGIDCAWLVEHHFLEEYSHSSAPELFLAAASQRTSRIRLGHGIVHTIPAINHPARVAERIATLDILSGGRVEFGTGEGSAAAELDGFGVDPADKRAMWEEGTRVALRCLSETPFTGHAGDARAPRRRATSCPSRSSARTRRCGSRAPAARRSSWPPGTASARCRSPSPTPRRPASGSTTTTRPSPPRAYRSATR